MNKTRATALFFPADVEVVDARSKEKKPRRRSRSELIEEFNEKVEKVDSDLSLILKGLSSGTLRIQDLGEEK